MGYNNDTTLLIIGQVHKNKPRHSAYNLEPITFPALALLISGEHAELVLTKNWFEYEIVAETKDDAVCVM